MTFKQPTTRDEWQHVANLCAACLLIDACKLYGLIDGGPDINPDQCQDLLDQAEQQGIQAIRDVDDLAMQLIREHNASVDTKLSKPNAVAHGLR